MVNIWNRREDLVGLEVNIHTLLMKRFFDGEGFSDIQLDIKEREKTSNWSQGVIDDWHPGKGIHIQLYDGDDLWLKNPQDLSRQGLIFENSSNSIDLKDTTKSLDVTRTNEVDLVAEEDVFDFFDINNKSPRSQTQPELFVQNPQEEPNSKDFDFEELDQMILEAGSPQTASANPPTAQFHNPMSPGFIKEDLVTHKEANREVMRSNLPPVDERSRRRINKRTVFLVGSVVSVTDLVIPLAAEDESGQTANLFFKVLFVEGGDDHLMFKCKTPIFNSDPSPMQGGKEVFWADSLFKVDMVMPLQSGGDGGGSGGPIDKDDSNGGLLKIQGEVIISLYKLRSNGGSDMLGQVSFNLAEIADKGTIEQFEPGYEGRSWNGPFPVCNRFGQTAGEVEIQLNIAWLAVLHKESVALAEEDHEKMSSSRPISRSASAASRITGPSRMPSGVSGASASLPNKAPTNKKKKPGSAASGTSKVKIASRFEIQQREQARKIERENLTLKNRLKKHESKYSTTVAARQSVYDKAPATAPTASSSSKPKATWTDSAANASNSVRAIQERLRESQQTALAGKGPRPQSAVIGLPPKSNYDALLEQYNALKKANRQDTQQNADLKANVNKLNVQISRCQTLIDKIHMKHPELAQPKSSSNAQIPGQAKEDMDAKGAKQTKPMLETNDERDETNSQHGVSVAPSRAFRDFIQPRKDFLDSDIEYRNLYEEYSVLHSVRRGLIDRVEYAQFTLREVDRIQQRIQSHSTMITQRLLALLESQASKFLHQGAGSTAVVSTNDFDSVDVSEIQTLKEYLKLKKELQFLLDTAAEKAYCYTQDSELAELEAVLAFYQKEVNARKYHHQALLQEFEDNKARFSQQSQSSTLLKLKEFIAWVQQRIFSLEAEERLHHYTEGRHMVELEFQRMELMAKERVAKSSAPN